MKRSNPVAIWIGANKETVAECKEAILAILDSECEEKTKRFALVTLRTVCQVTNTTISGCHIEMKP